MNDENPDDPWQDDLLEYREIGATFANLIQSLDEAKVISIEAGFGRGKTFFRKAWAEQLRQSGEIVVEIDARQSDHSGDPVISFLGALVEALPADDRKLGAEAISAAKKFGAVGARAVVKLALRSGADEIIDAVTENAVDRLDDFEALQSIIEEIGDGMSKAAGQMIASQLAAEKVRQTEMPEQLMLLREALTKDSHADRLIIIIDELDRCHPDYAIATLEAMKLVFDQAGFVFFLMINAHYLENLAKHRFGDASNDEQYLDKFVDIRLKIDSTGDAFKSAVTELARTIPLNIPFSEDEEFSVERAAELAGDLAIRSRLSMRKVKRVLLKVELATRCYWGQPIDLPLLVFLAFDEASSVSLESSILPRSKVTPEAAKELMDRFRERTRTGIGKTERENALIPLWNFIRENAEALIDLPRDRYSYEGDREPYDWAKILDYLAPNYLPQHRDMLNAVASFQK